MIKCQKVMIISEIKSIKRKNVKTKIKFYEVKSMQIFLKEDSHCICPSVKLIDSVLKIGNKYYCWMFLEKCKYIIKENKKTNTWVMT